MPRQSPWTLADVLDFEALIAADDRAGDQAALAARDARIWKTQLEREFHGSLALQPSDVFRRYVAARRGEETLPGTWLAAAWRWLGALACGAGLALGGLVSSGALYYAGARPVNVAVFAAATVGVQWIVLTWSLLLILSRGFRAVSEGALLKVGESLAQMVAGAIEHLSSGSRLRMRAEIGQLRRLTGRNLRLLVWPPLLALQGFGISWNFGVLAALLARVCFTDVAFGWESTVAQGPDAMETIARTLAAPWTWFAPQACPTWPQVERSWFHYDTGVAALDRLATASWWPWLVGLVIVYGLLPRLALGAYFWTHLRSALRNVSFDEPRHRAAWHRLSGPVIRPEQAQHDLPAHLSTQQPTEAAQAGAGCLLLASPLAMARADIEAWVAKNLGWRLAVNEIVEIDLPSGNEEALQRLAASLATTPSWMVAAPAPFTAFAAFGQFLARIEALAPTPAARHGFVLVATPGASGQAEPPSPDWARYWTDFLRAEAPECVTLTFTR